MRAVFLIHDIFIEDVSHLTFSIGSEAQLD